MQDAVRVIQIIDRVHWIGQFNNSLSRKPAEQKASNGGHGRKVLKNNDVSKNGEVFYGSSSTMSNRSKKTYLKDVDLKVMTGLQLL